MRSDTALRFVGPPGWRLIPPVTRAILVSTAAGYLATLSLGMSILVLAPVQVLSGEVWRLVTYPLVNVGILSVLFDLLLLWSFGSQMEPRFGSRRFALFLFLATLSAGALGVLADRLLPRWAFGAGFGWAAPLTALIVAWTLEGPSLPTNFFGILPMTRLGFAAIALVLVVFGELEQTRSLSRLLFVLGGLPVSWLFRGSGRGRGMRLPRSRSPFSRRKFRVVSGADERIH
jgi:membrane associated rhomboid family serine protease